MNFQFNKLNGRFATVLATLSVALVLTACGGGGGGGDVVAPPVVVTPPAALAMQPAKAVVATGLCTPPSEAYTTVSNGLCLVTDTGPVRQAAKAAPRASAPVVPPITPDELFNWAQVGFPTVFPAPSTTIAATGFVYRYYANTNSYVAVNDAGGVYVLFANELVPQVKYVAQIEAFSCLVKPTLAECVTPPTSLRYTDKVYALWTDKYPYAVTKSGVTKVKNMTQWNGLGKDLFLCFIANHPLTDGKILTLCKDLAQLKWHTLYIDPTKDEMYEYTGAVPSDLSYSVDPDGGIPAASLGASWLDWDKQTVEHPLWYSFAKVTDGYFYAEVGSSGGLLKFVGNDGVVSIIADKDPLVNGNGTIRVMWSYNN